MELEEREDYQNAVAAIQAVGYDVPRSEYRKMLQGLIGECNTLIRAADEDDEREGIS